MLKKNSLQYILFHFLYLFSAHVSADVSSRKYCSHYPCLNNKKKYKWLCNDITGDQRWVAIITFFK